MKTNIIRIQNFVNAANQFADAHKENEKANAAIRRVFERVNSCFSDYHRAWDDIKLSLANTDKNGSLLYNPNSETKEFAYTKEGYKELKKQTLELQREERFEFEPIIIETELVPEEYRPAFEGFVITASEKD